MALVPLADRPGLSPALRGDLYGGACGATWQTMRLLRGWHAHVRDRPGRKARLPRWLLLRGPVAVLASPATALASFVFLGIGGFLLVPFLLVGGVVQSFTRSPLAWVCYGSLLSPGLLLGYAGLADG